MAGGTVLTPGKFSADSAVRMDAGWRARFTAECARAGISARMAREVLLLVETGYLSLTEGISNRGAFGRAKAARDAAVNGTRQATLHLPVYLVDAVDRLAKHDGVSRSAMVAVLLKDALSGGRKGGK